MRTSAEAPRTAAPSPLRLRAPGRPETRAPTRPRTRPARSCRPPARHTPPTPRHRPRGRTPAAGRAPRARAGGRGAALRAARWLSVLPSSLHSMTEREARVTPTENHHDPARTAPLGAVEPVVHVTAPASRSPVGPGVVAMSGRL